MSNRGRQNVASYLARDLGVDWRQGAEWFEARLRDYDACSNWGNWVSAAGLAPGRAARFHVVKQVRHWCDTDSTISCWRGPGQSSYNVLTNVCRTPALVPVLLMQLTGGAFRA